MTSTLRSYIEEYKKVREDNSHPLIQRKELISLKKAIISCAKTETLTPEVSEQVNAIINDDIEWCD